ncbi:ribose-phosphate diphosphokinase [Nanoarchaeota archaeon]
MEGVILANPEGGAWNFANGVYNQLLGESPPNWILAEVETKEFSDGEWRTKINRNVRGRRVYFIHDSSLEPSKWLAECLFINEALHNSSASEICNVLPYMHFARQDRKDESRVAVSMKAVFDYLKVYAHCVLTADIHNPTTIDFCGMPADNLYSSYVFAPHIKERNKDFLQTATLVSPDLGSLKRTRGYATKLGVRKIAGVYKIREDNLEGKLANQEVNEMILLGSITPDCMIIDDIIDTGGTVERCVELLRKNSAKRVYGCFTHAVLSGKGKERLSLFDKIYVTDTIPRNDFPENVKVVSTIPLFATAIRNVHTGKSLSVLFK